jgi:hypothetical protein
MKFRISSQGQGVRTPFQPIMGSSMRTQKQTLCAACKPTLNAYLEICADWERELTLLRQRLTIPREATAPLSSLAILQYTTPLTFHFSQLYQIFVTIHLQHINNHVANH